MNFKQEVNSCVFNELICRVHGNFTGFLIHFPTVRLREDCNFGDGNCGVGKIHTRARNFEKTRREGSAKNFASRRISSKFLVRRMCISPAPQSPSPKLETTCSLSNHHLLFSFFSFLPATNVLVAENAHPEKSFGILIGLK